MESTVAALLLVTSTVVLSCFVVVYTVDTVTQTFSGENPTTQLLTQIQGSMMNSSTGGIIQFIYPTPTPTTTATPAP